MANPSIRRYRRRLSPAPSAAATALLLVSGSLLGSCPTSASTSLAEPLAPLDTATLTSNMRHWTTDYAVMFYAPWCQHCKELFMPLWEDVSMQMAEEDPRGKRKLVLAKFNCEQDTTAAAFCQEINLQFYPTFMFFGAGKFHDHDPLSGMVLGPRPTEHDSSAKFPAGAVVYHEVLAGWTKTMHFISGYNRVMERLNVFGGRGGRKDSAASEERLLEEIEALERKNHQLQQAMTGGETQESSLPYGHGDPYNELWKVAYDAEFEPVMSCVIDMAMQYCDVEGVKESDPWCSTLESCIATEFVGDECWPSSCPFQEGGCQITSFCLTPEMFDAYMQLIDEHDTAEEADEGVGAHWAEAGAETGTAAAAAEQAAAAAAAAAAGGAEAAAPGLPPFFGRPAGSQGGVGGGVDRKSDERGGEAVAA
ncbi:unnamed protein product [Ectocarpus sp. 6 AP-2014]